jgi:predicted alpha/beta-hydrolase family hydrolase
MRSRSLPVEEAGIDVSVRLDGPVGRAPMLVLGHGAGAGIDAPLMAALATALADRDIAVLRYQFPFMERRGGRGFGRDRLEVAVATVSAAVRLGHSHSGGHALFAGGHSYGGRMSTHAAAGLGQALAGLVLFSFPLHAAGKPDAARAAHLSALTLPLLFLSGDRDVMAEAPWLEQAVAGCAAGRLQRIPGADHGWKAPKGLWPQGVVPALADAVRAFVNERD